VLETRAVEPGRPAHSMSLILRFCVTYSETNVTNSEILQNDPHARSSKASRIVSSLTPRPAQQAASFPSMTTAGTPCRMTGQAPLGATSGPRSRGAGCRPRGSTPSYGPISRLGSHRRGPQDGARQGGLTHLQARFTSAYGAKVCATRFRADPVPVRAGRWFPFPPPVASKPAGSTGLRPTKAAGPNSEDSQAGRSGRER